MATFSAVTRQHVLQAIAEYDDRGADGFLGVYGFRPDPSVTFHHEGTEYDAQAVLGVAHRYATGRVAMAEDFADGKVATADVLRRCGFGTTGPARPETPVRAARAAAPRTRAPRAERAPRTPSATARRIAEQDRPVTLCPTCYMVLPATGICDTCG
ncbi:MAG TPA: hypothetical protein VGC67_05240 [Cellulomonas sp.]